MRELEGRLSLQAISWLINDKIVGMFTFERIATDAGVSSHVKATAMKPNAMRWSTCEIPLLVLDWG